MNAHHRGFPSMDLATPATGRPHRATSVYLLWARNLLTSTYHLNMPLIPNGGIPAALAASAPLTTSALTRALGHKLFITPLHLPLKQPTLYLST